MKRVWKFLAEYALVLAAVVAAGIVTADKAGAQVPIYVHPRDEPGLMLLSYATPPIYESWWKEIAACEGLPLPPAHRFVAFVAVNAREFGTYTVWDGISTIGYTDVASNTIYLAFPYLMDKVIVEHEMLHLLQLWAGERVGHDPKRYGLPDVGRCGVFPYRRDFIDDR